MKLYVIYTYFYILGGCQTLTTFIGTSSTLMESHQECHATSCHMAF